MNHSALFRMKRSVKIGTYSFVMGVIVLAALIVANLLVGALPAKVTRFSMNDQGITEVSDETVKFVSGMKEDVTVYWLCEGGEADEELSLFLARYEEAGKHVKVEIVDPLENPTFTSKYSDTALSQYSLIVESARRHTVVDYTTLFYYTNDFFAQELDGLLRNGDLLAEDGDLLFQQELLFHGGVLGAGQLAQFLFDVGLLGGQAGGLVLQVVDLVLGDFTGVGRRHDHGQHQNQSQNHGADLMDAIPPGNLGIAHRGHLIYLGS
jgi:hypothetical protein